MVPTVEALSRSTNTVLCIVAGLLAVMFLLAGLMKLVRPYEELGASMGWVEGYSPSAVRTIGGLEVVAAVGLIVPPLVASILAPVAAVGLAVTMVGAAVTHIRRAGETQMVVMNLVLLSALAFVAAGRFFVEPF